MTAQHETVLKVGGMTCEGCVRAVSRVLAKVEGAAAVEVDLTRGEARVRGDAAPEQLIAAVVKAGYEARLAG